MKSVFSAFKGRKADSNAGSDRSNSGGLLNASGHQHQSQHQSASHSNKSGNKSPINYENSYASLRQIRAADPFTKMSIATDDDLIDTTACIRPAAQLAHTPPPRLPSASTAVVDDIDDDDSVFVCESRGSNGYSSSSGSLQSRLGSGLIGIDVITSLPPAKPITMDSDAECLSAAVRMPVLSASDNNRLLKSGDLNTLRNSKNNSTRLGKRLSLTGLGNTLLPTVHGRPKTVCNGNGSNANGEPKTKTRFSHQRNLSLDFRSMGVLLPPVPQTATAHINLTQHHRNRSLDSALQRIPEVEVSSPTSEPKSTLCKNAFLSTGMCSKASVSPVHSIGATTTTAATTTTTKLMVANSTDDCSHATSTQSDDNPISSEVRPSKGIITLVNFVAIIPFICKSNFD